MASSCIPIDESTILVDKCKSIVEEIVGKAVSVCDGSFELIDKIGTSALVMVLGKR